MTHPKLAKILKIYAKQKAKKINTQEATFIESYQMDGFKWETRNQAAKATRDTQALTNNIFRMRHFQFPTRVVEWSEWQIVVHTQISHNFILHLKQKNIWIKSMSALVE